MKKLWTLCAAAMLLALAGCANPDADWADAQADGSEDAYLEFINRHPDAPQAAEARRRVVELRVSADWEAAEEADTVEAYESFLRKHPESAFTPDAEAALARLRVAAAWDRVRGSTDAAELSEFAETYAGTPEAAAARERAQELAPPEPEPEPEPEARPTPAAPDATHRVQLAAFGTSAAAQSGREQLARELRQVLGDIGLEVEGNGRMQRIVTAPLTQARARELCNQIQGLGRECFVRAR